MKMTKTNIISDKMLQHELFPIYSTLLVQRAQTNSLTPYYKPCVSPGFHTGFFAGWEKHSFNEISVDHSHFYTSHT